MGTKQYDSIIDNLDCFGTICFYMDTKLSLAFSSLIHVIDLSAFAWIQNCKFTFLLKKGGFTMAKYCPIRKEKVIYLECQECEDRRQCHSLQQPEEIEHPPRSEEIK